MIKINPLLKFIYIFIGFFIVIYIIYIRIFLVRIPKDLHINFYNENYKFIIFIISLILCVCAIINNIRIELNLNKVNNYLYIIFGFISKFIEDSLKHLYSFLMSFLKNTYNFISNLSKHFYEMFSKYPEYYLLFITYFIRIIIVFIFLTEIFLKFKLDYFYKSLTLLCIVLLIKLFIFILRDFSSNLELLKEALIITDKGIDEQTQLPITNYKLKQEYEDNDLGNIVAEFILCNQLTGYLHMYDCYNKFFNAKFNIIVYSLYFIGWFYILIINIL